MRSYRGIAAILRYPCRMTAGPTFRLNGADIALAGTEPTESLLRWLKRQHLHGTKEGCADGDCGACTVALVERDAAGASRYRAVNSCLLPMGMLPGREVVTVEGLADGASLHPVQQALVDTGGSQCGYCTPGFVMSLFVGHAHGELDDHATEGNLCRCTGYAPIRAATLALAAQPPSSGHLQATLARPRAAPPAASLADFHNPVTVDEALALKARHPQARWIAGATDLGVNLSHGEAVAQAFIALDRIASLQDLHVGADAVTIGAGIPLTRLQVELAGVFPALDEMLRWFAARQVRNRATLGGNLGSASPIGDLLPVLLALDATVHCQGPRGTRALPIDGFFQGYRRTARADDELITAVTLPRDPARRDAAYKVAKRQSDDISIVVAAFALRFDAARRIAHARLAYGGVAATPVRATATEAFLLGKALDAEVIAACVERLQAEFTPISDHRASADYRRQLCGTLFARHARGLAP